MQSQRGPQGRQIEWQGGLRSMPTLVTGEGVPYLPEILVWMVTGGPIVGMKIGRPGEVLPRAAEHLRETIQRPSAGPPGAPAQVRVASRELAAVLRAGLPPGTLLVQSPTADLDAMFDKMLEHLSRNSGEASYLPGDISGEQGAAFFRATAGLFRARPWAVFPTDSSLVSVTIESLGIRDAALCVIGQLGQSYGFLLFSSASDHEFYGKAAFARERGVMLDLPKHLAFSFDDQARVPPELRKEVESKGWELADRDAYPSAVAVEPGMLLRPPTSKELRVVEALSLALPEILPDERALLAAWSEGTPYARTISVKTQAGDLEVSLRAPIHEGPIARIDAAIAPPAPRPGAAPRARKGTAPRTPRK